MRETQFRLMHQQVGCKASTWESKGWSTRTSGRNIYKAPSLRHSLSLRLLYDSACLTHILHRNSFSRKAAQLAVSSRVTAHSSATKTETSFALQLEMKISVKISIGPNGVMSSPLWSKSQGQQRMVLWGLATCPGLHGPSDQWKWDLLSKRRL